jgi:hypothetical protein
VATDANDSLVFRELSEVLEEVGLAAVLIGGAAVNVYERPRYTKDVDLTVAPDAAKIKALVAALVSRGFTPMREQGAMQPSGPDFVQLARQETADRIDVIAAKTPYQELVIARASNAHGQWLPVATPEDLIILKLIAGRSNDWRDAEGLARHNPIDWPYVEHWAQVWQINDRLERLRASPAD